MTLQALLVSKDDDAADVLIRVLAGFGVAVERFSETEIALQRLGEQRFDSLIVDFDEPDTARHLLEALPQSKPGALITMALLSFQGMWNNFLAPLVFLNTAEMFPLTVGLNFLRGQYGTFYNGTRAALTIAKGRVAVSPHLPEEAGRTLVSVRTAAP